MMKPQNSTSSSERERCWVVHKRRALWALCPLCGAPIKWVRLFDGSYSPCDEEPVLFWVPESKKGRYKVVSKGELIDHASLKIPKGETAKYARLPHFYACPVLREERREWALKHKIW